jgi:hypothetical protein
MKENKENSNDQVVIEEVEIEEIPDEECSSDLSQHRFHAAPPPDYSWFMESGWQRFWKYLGIGFVAYLCHCLIKGC